MLVSIVPLLRLRAMMQLPKIPWSEKSMLSMKPMIEIAGAVSTKLSLPSVAMMTICGTCRRRAGVGRSAAGLCAGVVLHLGRA